MLSKLEVRRKFFHIISGVVLIILLRIPKITKLDLVILLAIGIIISLLSKRYKLPIVSWFLSHLDRKKEKLPGKGGITFLLGCIIVLYLFPLDTALVSIAVLSLGDGTATIMGKLGKIKTELSKKKTLEGSIYGILAGTLAAYTIVPLKEAFLTTFIAMLIEATDFKIKWLDDNITVPLSAAIVLTLLRLII